MAGNNLDFIDSMQVLNCSEDLVKNVPKINSSICLKNLVKIIRISKQKRHYPYEYMNSFGRFGDIKLPNQQYFYRTLNNKDFEHALKIWNEF